MRVGIAAKDLPLEVKGKRRILTDEKGTNLLTQGQWPKSAINAGV